jgi:hypothetical protein
VSAQRVLGNRGDARPAAGDKAVIVVTSLVDK